MCVRVVAVVGCRLNAMLEQISLETGVTLSALTRVTKMCLLSAFIAVRSSIRRALPGADLCTHLRLVCGIGFDRRTAHYRLNH
jgi:hypothetical protein